MPVTKLQDPLDATQAEEGIIRTYVSDEAKSSPSTSYWTLIETELAATA